MGGGEAEHVGVSVGREVHLVIGAVVDAGKHGEDLGFYWGQATNTDLNVSTCSTHELARFII